MAQSAAVGRDSMVCLRQPGAVPAGDVLAAWAERTGRRRAAVPARGGLRFAFYGRVSTEDWQDPVASRARQRDQAAALVAGHGRIVAGFFDVGYSRALAWARRLQAAALVAALADPDRGWDAIVIGEYERAFYGSQYASMAPLFEHYGIQLWTPEAGGRIGYGTEDHEQMMLALGYQSRREIARTKIRVRTAMAPQTREQGRYLGGRPPYGYQLADAGPHPDKAHAAWGRRARRLAPDPATRRWWRGCSPSGYRATASRGSPRALNDAAVPCPSAAGPQRNPHRAGTAWTLGSVAAILANPRYTGRQVWNRQRTDFDRTGPASTGLGHRPVQRWNLPAGWVISAHPAIVGEAGYIAVQDVSAARGAAGPATRRYLLAGLLRCGRCGRRLESAWSNGKPAYRCRHGYTSAAGPGPGGPKNVHIREDQILPRLTALAILQAAGNRAPDGGNQGSAKSTAPAQAADLIDHLRAVGVSIIDDPATRAQIPGMTDLLGGHGRRTPEAHATGPGGVQALPGALDDQLADELRQRGEHVEDQSAAGGGGIERACRPRPPASLTSRSWVPRETTRFVPLLSRPGHRVP